MLKDPLDLAYTGVEVVGSWFNSKSVLSGRLKA